MKRTLLAFPLLLLACATATIERSPRNEVAVATAAREERLNFAVSVRIRPQQIFVPSRADGQEEWCSTSPTWFAHNQRPLLMCFRDSDGRGRFDRAYLPREKREGGGYEVNVPYTAQPFPCSSCVVSSADLTRIADPQILAEQSIAPQELRPYVQLVLSNSPDVDAAIERSSLSDKAGGKAAVHLAAREVRDRRAVAICSSQNPGAAASMFGLIGSLATVAGSYSETQCMDEYIRSGAMPIIPAPVQIPGSSG